MRQFINLINEAQQGLDMNGLMAQYNATVAKMVEDGKNGIFHTKTDNPLVGVIHAINHLAEETGKPNPLMGMAVSNGVDHGTVLPAPVNQYIAMVRKTTTGDFPMTTDIWVPKKFGKFIAPQNLNAVPKRLYAKEHIPADLSPDMKHSGRIWKFTDPDNAIVLTFHWGIDTDNYKAIVWGIYSPLTVTKYTSASASKKIRGRWKALGRTGEPRLLENEVVDTLKKLGRVAPVYFYTRGETVEDGHCYRELADAGISAQSLIDSGVVAGLSKQFYSG